MKFFVNKYKEGKLRELYDSEYGEEARNFMIENGIVVVDKSVSNFLKYKNLI